MSFVGFCSNSSVSPSSSDPNLYTPSAPGYVCDGPAWPINPGNSAFNGITLSVDEESCRSPWCKTESFPTKLSMTEPKTTSFTSGPFGYLPFDEPSSRHSFSLQTYESSPSSMWTIREVKDETTYNVSSGRVVKPRSADLSRFKMVNSSNGNEDLVSLVFDGPQKTSISDMSLDELLKIDRTPETTRRIRLLRNRRAALQSRQRKAEQLETLETDNKSLRSDNEDLLKQLDRMNKTNTMLTDQLEQRNRRIMELESQFLTMRQTYNTLQLLGQDIPYSSDAYPCGSFRPPSDLMDNKSSGVIEDYNSTSVINGNDSHL